MRLLPGLRGGTEANIGIGQREEPVRDTLPPFVGILSNGTSGDINNISFLEPRPGAKPFEQIRNVASRPTWRSTASTPTGLPSRPSRGARGSATSWQVAEARPTA